MSLYFQGQQAPSLPPGHSKQEAYPAAQGDQWLESQPIIFKARSSNSAGLTNLVTAG
jgi:hypothetical protein